MDSGSDIEAGFDKRFLDVKSMERWCALASIESLELTRKSCSRDFCVFMMKWSLYGSVVQARHILNASSLCLRLVGEVGTRINVMSSYSQRWPW